MKKIIIASVLSIILLGSLIYCHSPIYAWAQEWTQAIIGGLSGSDGVALKVDSNGQVYVNMSGMTLIYTGSSRGGVSTIVSSVSKLSSANLAFAILKLSGAEKTFSMVNGSNDGQQVTLVKDENDARTLALDLTIDIDNATHTGFSSVIFNSNAGSYVTLVWVDSTIGWIITGSEGVTINY